MSLKNNLPVGWLSFAAGAALLVAGCGGQQAASSPASTGAAASPASASAAAAASKPAGGSAAASAKPAGSAAANASGGAMTLDQLYQAAKAEGSVQISMSNQDDQWLPLQKAFSERFPGIKADRLEISPNKGLERIITEKAAGKTTTDVAGARMTEIKQAVDRDLAAQFDYVGTFNLPKEMVLNDNRYVLGYQNVSLLSYNTKLLNADTAPKTWDDLTDPRFANGKILMAQDADDVFWGLGEEWGRDKLMAYAQKIHDQKPRFTQQSSETTNLLIAGDAPVAMSIYAASMMKYTDQGAPIKATAASPVTVNNNGVFVLKDAPHPNAARLFAGWLATPEAQKVFDSATHRSVAFPSTDTGHAKFVRDLGVKLIYEDPAKADENTKLQADAMAIVTGKPAKSK